MIRVCVRVWLSVFNAPPDAPNLLLPYPFHTVFFIIPPPPPHPIPNEVEGGYTGFTLPVCPSVRLWAESCPQCIIHNTSCIHFIFTDLNNQLQKVCRVLSFVTNSKIWIFGNFFKISPFTLSCVHVMRMLIPLIRVFIVATSNFPCWYLWVIY